MSTKKIHVPTEIYILVLKAELGLERDYEIAEMLGLEPNAMSNRRRSGTLVPLLRKLAEEKHVVVPDIGGEDGGLGTCEDEIIRRIMRIKSGDRTMYEALARMINENYIVFLESGIKCKNPS